MIVPILSRGGEVRLQPYAGAEQGVLLDRGPSKGSLYLLLHREISGS